jgi:tRNA(fMet)-specific endonuclease VapC
MTYVWDTNIFIKSLRNPAFFSMITNQYDSFNPANKLYISTVTIGELHAFALRNRWDNRRITEMEQMINLAVPISVTNHPFLIKMYAEIDVYSQSHHPTLSLPTSARKMSKNDLWIAATTALYNGVLLSTDNDFEHLDGLFLTFEKITA